jgi:hypothetical protein
MINALLNSNAVNNTGKTLKLRTWPWGKVGKRLGGSRSADGVIIDLPDGRSRNGSNVVAKFIFAEDSANLNRAKQEYIIGNMMSKAGVGPKVFDYYEMGIDANGLENLFKKASGSSSVNLFQGNGNLPFFNTCIVIIMENLYKGPGVVDTYTVYEGYRDKKPIPFEKIRAIIDKMHKVGVIHADMHQNNIMIQKIKTRLGYKYRPLIIDFGRSLKTNKSFKTNANANAYAKMNRHKNKLWWYSNKPNVMPVLLNGNGWLMAKKYNTRAPKGPGLMTKIAAKFATNKKINYIENITSMNNVAFIRYYWNARSNNQTKPALIKNIILEIGMIKMLLANKNSGITNSYVSSFFNKIYNYSKKTVTTTSDYYKIYKGLSKMTLSQLTNVKASIPNLG